MFLYLGLASGAARVVAPISAAIGTAIPVLAGWATGTSPSVSAWCGIVVAALAIVMLSYHDSSGTTTRTSSHPVFYAVVSGVMIGLFLVCYGWSGKDAGLWPLLAARSVAVTWFLSALIWTRTPLRVPASIGGLAVVAGVLDIIANGCYLVAARTGNMSIVATLANLYPVATVACAAVFLHERPNRLQSAGFLLALGAIVLLTR
jgi:drug/metabolite transporter (DMT)-like permease